MSELKTLKDLKEWDGDCEECATTWGHESDYEPIPCVEIEELRKEAIKWFKYCEEETLNSAQWFIKEFFNFTDEELNI